jgi:DNA-binding GntR family transcriptional regulator
MPLAELSQHGGIMALVTDELRSAIARGEFQPGERLRQQELAQRLGVSREPVRHALRFLEAEGLLVQRPRRGVVVASITNQDVRDLYDVRAAVGGMAARRAAEHLPADFDDAARPIFDAAAEHLQSGDIVALVKDDFAFHELVTAASGNGVALDLLRANANRVRVVMQQALVAGRGEQAWREHGAILAALLAGDADLAEELVKAHALGAAEIVAGLMAMRESSARG